MSDQPQTRRPRPWRRPPRADAGAPGQAGAAARRGRRAVPRDRRAHPHAGRGPGDVRRPGARAGHPHRRAGRGHRPGDVPAQHRQALLRPAARGRRHRAPGDAVAGRRRRGAAGASSRPLVDLGDLLAVRGEVVTSRRGELSVQAHRLVGGGQDAAPAAQRAQAALRRGPDPAALRRHDGAPRAARRWCAPRPRCSRACAPPSTSASFVEVETPILQLTNGGAAARPFRTHLNALDQEMLLRIALELDLKRAMIGGVDRVYEIGRTFRNEGLDSTHAAEFSMLEAYEAYGDQHTMMELAKALVRDAHRAIGSPVVPRPRRHRDRPATASGARRRSSSWSPRRVGDDGRRGHRRGDAARLRRQARRRAAGRTGGPPRSSSSSTSSSSRTPWSSRRSSWTTPRPSSRWPSRTARRPASTRRGT